MVENLDPKVPRRGIFGKGEVAVGHVAEERVGHQRVGVVPLFPPLGEGIAAEAQILFLGGVPIEVVVDLELAVFPVAG